jgi:hypothetical protein
METQLFTYLLVAGVLAIAMVAVLIEADQAVRVSDPVVDHPTMALEESRAVAGPRPEPLPRSSGNTGRADVSVQTREARHE